MFARDRAAFVERDPLLVPDRMRAGSFSRRRASFGRRSPVSRVAAVVSSSALSFVRCFPGGGADRAGAQSVLPAGRTPTGPRRSRHGLRARSRSRNVGRLNAHDPRFFSTTHRFLLRVLDRSAEGHAHAAGCQIRRSAISSTGNSSAGRFRTAFGRCAVWTSPMSLWAPDCVKVGNESVSITARPISQAAVRDRARGSSNP
jgi:hypothetical protein